MDFYSKSWFEVKAVEFQREARAAFKAGDLDEQDACETVARIYLFGLIGDGEPFIDDAWEGRCEQVFFVEIAGYAGDGHWFDYPPYEFGSAADANDFAKVSGMNSQSNLLETKVRRIYSKIL